MKFIVSVGFVCLITSTVSAQVPSIGAFRSDFEFLQKDAPAQVVGVHMGLESKDLCDRVVVVNLSSRTIVAVQFGWTISDTKKPNSERVAVSYSPVLDVKLAPSEVDRVGPLGATIDSVTKIGQQLQLDRAFLVTGIVYAKFDDGSEWYYPLKERKAFVQYDNPAVLEKMAPKVREFRLRNRIAGARSCGAPTKAMQIIPAVGNLSTVEFRNAAFIPNMHLAFQVTFVCDPSPRTCQEEVHGCTTYYCDPPIGCNNVACCLLNLRTGEEFCN